MMNPQFPNFSLGMNNPTGVSFPPTFGNHTVQPPQWGMNMMNGADGMELHHTAGPMRRGRGGFAGGMRSAGPYDRRQQGQRFGNGPMMMGSAGNPMGMRRGGFGGGGKWGDGAGAQAMGPKEAVQGRVLKRYDDLDAVDGGATGAAGGAGGGAELNY